MKLSSFVSAAAALLLAASASAQNPATITDPNTPRTNNDAVNNRWQPSLVPDGIIGTTPHKVNTVAWQPVREADVLWSKRVWREINILERQNMAFRYPGDAQTGGGLFIEILFDAIKKGKVKAYSALNDDDRFTRSMTNEQINVMLAGTVDTQDVVDVVTGVVTRQIIRNEFNTALVTRYLVKEDVIFDRNLGRQVTRIVGIAPVADKLDPATMEVRGQYVMFWLYYPELRELLGQYEVFNPENDVARITWDDYFEGRRFSSRIIKTSNPFNRSIEQSYPGVEGLYQGMNEAERIFNKEHDMWQY